MSSYSITKEDKVMIYMFRENLRKLAKQYSQKGIADKTGFSQSSINNYLTKNSEPSIQFLISLKNAFGINVDDFLFSGINAEIEKNYDKYIGNYLIYYYNNDSYKGEVHSNIKNTLNYGVLSIYKEKELDKDVKVLSTFTKNRVDALRLLRALNKLNDNGEFVKEYTSFGNVYEGELDTTEQNIFISLFNKEHQDKSFIILNNPPSNAKYIGGVGTENSISRGREHNPCAQFIILSKKLLDIPDGELYDLLKFNDYMIDTDDSIKDIINLFKRLYVSQNELSAELSDTQKTAIIKNRIDLLLSDVFEANAFRFAKVSNREDDVVYRYIKEGIDV